MSINDIVINVATVNGTGSQSANNILVRTLFRMGLPVSGKNLFPSNIQGLPTWFNIRVCEKGLLSRRHPHDLVIGMNPKTLSEDIQSVKKDGVFLYNSDIKLAESLLRNDTQNFGVPFKKIAEPLSDSVRLKKLLTNVIYVGVLGELIGMDHTVAHAVINDQFHDKPGVVKINQEAYEAGVTYAKENLDAQNFPLKVKSIPKGNKEKILIDGNSAAAMGLVFAGCTFASWYPITPSSSLIESFEGWAKRYRQNPKGENTYAVVQAEDELSAMSMVIGAGWAGARAMTATSGPGFSLMSEAAGLSYFAEIPAVIWDVQRVGPSTGLPTRTMQADVTTAARFSHGDTLHVVLFPASPEECFEMAQTAFDLAEQLQTLVIVLSDLDLGMNFSISKEFKYPEKPFQRGKVLKKQDLDKMDSFERYKDVDGDGICYRTLPGTEHPKAAYFTRGTGHDEKSNYTEDNQAYRDLLDRLRKKYETAKKYVPAPVIENDKTSSMGFIGFGSSDEAIQEARHVLREDHNTSSSYLRLRALPFTPEVEDFLRTHEQIFLVEQNRDAQLRQLILEEYPDYSHKLKSIRQYDGLPLEGRYVLEGVLQ